MKYGIPVFTTVFLFRFFITVQSENQVFVYILVGVLVLKINHKTISLWSIKKLDETRTKDKERVKIGGNL